MSLSLNGFQWQIKTQDMQKIYQVAELYDLDPTIVQLCLQRDIAPENIHKFLHPTLKDTMSEPYSIKDMQKAVEATVTAINNQEKMIIFADYDVDGATSSSLLRRYLKEIDVDTELYIPDRIEEGYGPSVRAMEEIVSQGYRFCIMADCGTTAFQPLEKAHDLGLNIIILDHHVSEKKLPPCVALVNPNRVDEDLSDDSDLKNLCAAGLSFLFLVALNRALRQGEFFKNTIEPDLKNYLDIVALGTVCDVMPLTNLNRTFVKQGLRVAKAKPNIGLQVLAETAELHEISTPYHFGFVLGPRINAGGRVGHADYGSRLLTTNDKTEAKKYAEALCVYNSERQSLEKQALQEAQVIIAAENLDKKPILMVQSKNWHPGIIGIVAGRLKDFYQKPTLVVTAYDGSLKGSGRSVSDIHLGNLMHKAVQAGYLEKGGGHAMAAGFTVAAGQYDAFYNFLEDQTKDAMQYYVPSLHIAAENISFQDINKTFLNTISALEPYGQGNPTPKFLFKNIEISYHKLLKEKHATITLKDDNGATLQAMAFNVTDSPLKKLLDHKCKWDVVGTLKLDTWQGQDRIKLMLDDARETYS